MTDVHLLLPAVLMHDGQLLFRANQLRVHAGKPDSAVAADVQPRDDIRVDLADQYHADDFHRFLIGHAETADKLGVLADLFQEARDIRAAAMHNDRTDTDLLHQRHVLHDLFFQFLADHRVAAVFDHDGLARELLEIRQRLDEQVRFVLR